MVCLGRGDRGEAVAGADHLHASSRSARARSTAATIAAVSAGVLDACAARAVSRPDQLRPRRSRRDVSTGHAGRRHGPAKCRAPRDGAASGRRGPRPRRRRRETRYAADAPWWSTTSPLSVAPGATPATSPVCMIAIPSVSRAGGTSCLGQRHRGDHRRRDREAADEQDQRPSAAASRRSSSGAIAAAIAERAPPHPERRPARARCTAPVTTPATRLPSAHSASRAPDERLVALLVGERDGGHLGGAEQDAEARRRPRRAGRRCATASAAGAPTERSCGWAGGSVRALGGEGQAAADAGDDRDGEAGDRVHGGGEHGDQDRAEDEDGLVDHRLERERRLHVGRLVEHVRPAGPHARADLGQRARRPGPRRRTSTPDRPVRLHRPAPAATMRDPERRRSRRQHPALARAGRASRPCRIAQHRVGDHVGRRRPPRRRRTSRSPPRPAARCPGRPSRSAAGRPGRSARSGRAPGCAQASGGRT